MTKHSDRIWRTVVFAGAMLGAPVVAAESPKGEPVPPKNGFPDKPKPPPKPQPADKDAKPKPPETAQSVQKELFAIAKEIKTATDAVSAAKSDAERKAAKAKLDAHAKTKADLEKKLADFKKAATPLGKLEIELSDNQIKIDAAIEAVSASQNEADRATAKAKLTALQNDKVTIERKIAAEKQRLARPRTPESDKPIGRGFILS